MSIHEGHLRWVLETEHTSYALGVNTQGLLLNLYWGPRLPAQSDYPEAEGDTGWASFNGPGMVLPEEYPAYAGAKYVEPCFKAALPDGVRDTVLRFERAEIADEVLRLFLRDAFYPLEIVLVYHVHAAVDLIERHTEITWRGEEPITLERVFSAQWHVPAGEPYRLTHLSGRWMNEFTLHRDLLTPGVKVLESRRITTSHHHQPWFVLDEGAADEEQGRVWFGLLAWSGNWKLTAEVTDFQTTRLGLGLNDFDFAWRLQPGETFITPPALAGFTNGGFGAASRVLHDYLRDGVMPHPGMTHKVLYNSWEATTFNVDEAGQMKLADEAARLGVELFVMDDGWFHGRNHDSAGLGDWWPDEAKFPNGLTPLIEHVKALKMEFGLWIEPEMVNPDSDLYRAHPEWVIHFPNRERTTMRNQLVLNLARADVQDYLIDHLSALLCDHDIRFIKWDMNRNVSEPGWPSAPGDPRELWVRYVQGVYRVWGALHQQFPRVIFQSCSGGGGRADAGILRYADQIWVSDNTEAVTRLGIQEGFSQVYPASAMEAWVTDMNPNDISLQFRFHSSMCGVLGIGGNLLKWSESQLNDANRYVGVYKEVRHIIQDGDLYRLRSAQAGPFSAVQYVSKDRSEAVLFAFRTHQPLYTRTPALRLRGLIPEARYRVQGFHEPRSGAAWMNDGLRVQLDDFESTLRQIRRV